MRTINGIEVYVTRAYSEGAAWRWEIVDVRGGRHTDEAYYSTMLEAERACQEALKTGHLTNLQK